MRLRFASAGTPEGLRACAPLLSAAESKGTQAPGPRQRVTLEESFVLVGRHARDPIGRGAFGDDPPTGRPRSDSGLVDQATEEYRHAIAVAPRFTPAIFSLAIIRAEQGAVDEAIGLYRDVIAVDADATGP